MSKGAKIYSSSTHKERLTWSWSSHLQRLIVDLVNTVSRDTTWTCGPYTVVKVGLFVKQNPPSILPCGGDKHYNAFKDVLAPICFSIVVNLEWHLRLRVMLEDPTSQPLKTLTLKGKSFLHNKQVGDRLHCIHLVRCLLI